MTAGSVSLRFFKSCILTLVPKRHISTCHPLKRCKRKICAYSACSSTTQKSDEAFTPHSCTQRCKAGKFQLTQLTNRLRPQNFGNTRTAPTFQLPTSKKLDEPSPSSVCRSTSVCNTGDLSCLFPCYTQSDSFNDYMSFC